MAYTCSQEPEVDGHFHILLIQELGNFVWCSQLLTLERTAILDMTAIAHI